MKNKYNEIYYTSIYIYIILIYSNKNNNYIILQILHSSFYIFLIFNLLCLYEQNRGKDREMKIEKTRQY